MLSLAKLLTFSTLAITASATPTLTQMMGFLGQFGQDWTYPRLVEIANNVSYSGLDPDVVGRLDVTSTFPGSELNTEYLFGVFADFAQAKNTSLIGVPLNQTVAELIVQGNSLFVSLIVTFNWTVEIVPVQFNVLFMFNDEGKVIQYDAKLGYATWIFPKVIPKLVPRLAKELDLPITTNPTTLLAKRAAYDICSAHEQFCVESNQQYNTTEECMDFIENKVPLGDLWQAGQNTAICRYVHKAMVSRRPEVHCSHIGPTGGDMCYDKNYVDLILENPYKNPFIQLPGLLTLEQVGALISSQGH